jgi:hypothetical protein
MPQLEWRGLLYKLALGGVLTRVFPLPHALHHARAAKRLANPHALEHAYVLGNAHKHAHAHVFPQQWRVAKLLANAHA